MRVEHETRPNPKLRTVPFRDDTIDLIAETLDVQLDLAPFQLPGAHVYQLTISGIGGRPAVMITLWPSLRRVDAIGAASAIVFTQIDSVQLVDGVEALFHRASGEYLVVSKSGKLIVRS